VTVNAVDANWNVVTNVTDTASITSTDANATLPSDAALVNGTQSLSVTLRTAGTATLTASDVTDNTKASNTSPRFRLDRSFCQVTDISSGRDGRARFRSGKTGTPAAQTAGAAFNVTVNAVDANWNLINTNDTVAITCSDANSVLPANAGLVSGK
jgi:hypothetical protein